MEKKKFTQKLKLGKMMLLLLAFFASNIVLKSQCTLPPAPAGPAVCPINLVQYGGVIPNGTGLFAQNWVGGNQVPAPGANLISTSFTGTDAFGLPAHPNPASNVEPNFPFSGIGDLSEFGTIMFNSQAEQGQVDGWLAVPACFAEIPFQLGGGFADEGAVYLGSSLNDMVEVVNSSGTTTATYTVPTIAATVTINTDCDYRILRVRMYHTDPSINGQTNLDWNIGDGFEEISTDYMFPAIAVDDNTPPSMIDSKPNNCEFAYEDANGDLYIRNNNTTLGAGIALNPGYCEKILGTVTSNVDVPNVCDVDFTCGAAPVRVDFLEPNLPGTTYEQQWTGIDAYDGPGNAQGPTTDAFSNIGVDGYPEHPNAPTLVTPNQTPSNGFNIWNWASSINTGLSQWQMDAWVAVPPNISCFEIQLGAGGQSNSMHIGPDYFNMDYNGLQGSASNNFTVLTEGASTFGCGWQWMRVRFYVHNEAGTLASFRRWIVDGTLDQILPNYIFAADSPTDNDPPILTTDQESMIVNSIYGLQDEAGTIWEIAANTNCNVAPNNSLDLTDHLMTCIDIVDVEDAADCNGDAACLNSLVCDPCQIEIEEEGCICDNPDNIFSSPKPTDVTQYFQTVIIESVIDGSYTIENVVGTTIIDNVVFGTGNNAYTEITFLATPDVAYSFDVVGNSSGISSTHAGECSAPGPCNCPVKPEVCGDGLDNDCDGAVDGADSDILGNCELDCEATPIEIQGKMLMLDGHVTHQVWSADCGNTQCCQSRGRHSCALKPFTNTDPNGLPMHQNGAAGCAGNESINTFGSSDRSNPELFSTRSEQSQLDAWIVLPPGIQCFELKVNHPRAYDAQAVYLGQGIASMEFVGATSFPPSINYTSDGLDATDECNGSTQASKIFNYDASAIPTFGCGWRAVRARAYTYDESVYHITPVQWNIGNGFVNIPSKFIQSVGPAGWDTDNNKPTVADEADTAPFCAYQDVDGDLFLQNGSFYALSTQKCETIVTNDCLACPDNLSDCVDVDECIYVVVDPVTGATIQSDPSCDLEVFQVTPRVIDPISGSLLATFWDGNEGSGFTGSILNEPYLAAFSDFTNSATCPGCLPQHPNTANYTDPTKQYQSSVLGVIGSEIPDLDGDPFSPLIRNVRGGENVQQDGWLIVPPGMDCIEFSIGGSTGNWDASGLYAGKDIDNMYLVGDNINRRGRNPRNIYSFEIPTDLNTIPCTPCNEDLKLLRLRFYHHDNGAFGNTTVQWNLGSGFVNIPNSHLRPVADQCDNTLPTCPTFSEGTPYLTVLDENGDYYEYNPTSGLNWPNESEGDDGVDRLINRAATPGGCDLIEPVCGDPTLEILDTKGLCELCCQIEIFCPTTAGIFDCEDEVEIDAWLNSYTTELCDESGLTITNDYDRNDFDKCVTTTNTITFSILDAMGMVLSSCTADLTINSAAPAILTTPQLPETLSCTMADGYIAPDATFTNNLIGVCENIGNIASSMQYNFDACGGTMTVSYSGLDDCGNTLTAGPFTINVEEAPEAIVTLPTLPLTITCEVALTFIPDDATYTNGLAGVCNISGNIPPVVIPFFDACGGYLRIVYSIDDACGRDTSVPDTTIQVSPAALPIITIPSLPSSLTCEEAISYIPPIAQYTNASPGVCLISGNVPALVNHLYDACGGVLEVIYAGEDECGRSLEAMITSINVQPAPIPIIDVPNFPTDVSCSEAVNFDVPLATYNNGVDGVCNISGLVEPIISYNVNAGNGGTISITYSGVDECGNVLLTNAIVVQVTPASLPILESPQYFSNSISCGEAINGFYPGNATYTNDESGFCENSGEIPVVETSEYWDDCDGGYIIYDYSGVDNYGNELNELVLKVFVIPDETAPEGGCAPYSEVITSIQDVPEPDELDYYFGQVASGYYEECGEVVVNVIGDTGTPVCDGNNYFSRIYTVEIADQCGNVAGECSITFSGSCSQYICTMDQKFYGNPDDEINGQTSGEIINALIGNGTNPIIVGDGNDCGIIIDDVTCIQAMLNSSGSSISLPPGYSMDCFEINNSLINQIVVTTLNIRYNLMMNPTGEIDFGGLTLDEACLNVPGFILNEMPVAPTVNDLLAYANDFIACQCSGTCGNYLDDDHPIGCLTNLFWGLNSRFNNCQDAEPCSPDYFNLPSLEISEVKNKSIKLYPNPTKESINIRLNDFIGLPVTIEMFDTRGTKLSDQTYQAISQNVLEIDVQNFEAGLYWLSIEVEGYDQITKKVILID